jgi:glycosyltransferase involved in cell wall biosynthesis
LRVLQVSISDVTGGAEKVALDLHQAYLQAGHRALLVVGTKRSDVPGVIGLNPPRESSAGFAYRILRRLEYSTGVEAMGYWRFKHWWRAYDHKWDVVHFHNLHSSYMDLGVLPEIARTTPILQTLHDCWQFTGHCAHPMACERWRIGCGACPDLAAYPAVGADRTGFNWRRKRRLYAAARPSLVVPSEWLQNQVATGFLKDFRCKHIYNGVDIRRFVPGDRTASRVQLGLPVDKTLLLYVGSQGLKGTAFKDPELALSTLRHLVRSTTHNDVVLVAVGGKAPVPDELSPFVIQRDHVTLGLELYYQAADLYLHCSKADTFGLVIAEAMSCGLPVITTDVGACGELVADGVTGAVVPTKRPEAFVLAVERLLDADTRPMRQAAVEQARSRFSLSNMVDRYLELYGSLVTENEQ